MKVLLVGEYSRFHNSLKEGLLHHNCEVTIVGHGDSFKNFPVDFNIDAKVLKGNGILSILRKVIHKLSRFDIASLETYLRFNQIKKQLSGFDIVQFINETPLNISLKVEKNILRYLLQHNQKAFLVSCSDDYVFINFLMTDVLPYSTMTPYLQNKKLIKRYQHTLRYVTQAQKNAHSLMFEHILGVIPASVEYQLAYAKHPKVLPMIPYPINIDKISYQPIQIDDRILIFHGINKVNYYKKGNNYFEKALAIIKAKYNHKIEIITTESLPYQEYIAQLQKAHIVLDQVFAHDQGFNALEAMAMGKVVFTGAGDAFQQHYNLKEQVVIPTQPDVDAIANQLEALILQPERAQKIGENARAFVEQHHDYKKVAAQYLDCWHSVNKY
ncbi:glycosyltransferase [Aquimarina brevivitae]|uniref:Glycosyl transferase family 1 n=1 Tax=Aquimarina brevivitae TaxID=323412 RepID=A0A4Q7NZU5_9FLAO|nr:glycosyltransferase [Aquimarina brevivitae]RZS91892.1 glycosyl transferase family 1 [Aquimarina brevivitae]